MLRPAGKPEDQPSSLRPNIIPPYNYYGNLGGVLNAPGVSHHWVAGRLSKSAYPAVQSRQKADRSRENWPIRQLQLQFSPQSGNCNSRRVQYRSPPRTFRRCRAGTQSHSQPYGCMSRHSRGYSQLQATGLRHSILRGTLDSRRESCPCSRLGSKCHVSQPVEVGGSCGNSAIMKVTECEPWDSPASQVVHADWPMSTATLPASQKTQRLAGLLSSSNMPRSQFVHTILPSPLYCPATQLVHGVVGSASLSAFPYAHLGQNTGVPPVFDVYASGVYHPVGQS